MPDINKSFEILLQGLIFFIPAIIFAGVIWSMVKSSFPEINSNKKSIFKNLEALEKLKKLHLDGVIDDEEFKNIKSKIIGDIDLL